MNAKISVVICVEAIMYLLLYNLHDCTFKYRNILRQSINQNFGKAKYIMENVPENDNFNELLAIRIIAGEKYSKIKTLNEDILNILL